MAINSMGSPFPPRYCYFSFCSYFYRALLIEKVVPALIPFLLDPDSPRLHVCFVRRISSRDQVPSSQIIRFVSLADSSMPYLYVDDGNPLVLDLPVNLHINKYCYEQASEFVRKSILPRIEKSTGQKFLCSHYKKTHSGSNLSSSYNDMPKNSICGCEYVAICSWVSMRSVANLASINALIAETSISFLSFSAMDILCDDDEHCFSSHAKSILTASIFAIVSHSGTYNEKKKVYMSYRDLLLMIIDLLRVVVVLDTGLDNMGDDTRQSPTKKVNSLLQLFTVGQTTTDDHNKKFTKYIKSRADDMWNKTRRELSCEFADSQKRRLFLKSWRHLIYVPTFHREVFPVAVVETFLFTKQYYRPPQIISAHTNAMKQIATDDRLKEIQDELEDLAKHTPVVKPPFLVEIPDAFYDLYEMCIKQTEATQTTHASSSSSSAGSENIEAKVYLGACVSMIHRRAIRRLDYMDNGALFAVEYTFVRWAIAVVFCAEPFITRRYGFTSKSYLSQTIERSRMALQTDQFVKETAVYVDLFVEIFNNILLAVPENQFPEQMQAFIGEIRKSCTAEQRTDHHHWSWQRSLVDNIYVYIEKLMLAVVRKVLPIVYGRNEHGRLLYTEMIDKFETHRYRIDKECELYLKKIVEDPQELAEIVNVEENSCPGRVQTHIFPGSSFVAHTLGLYAGVMLEACLRREDQLVPPCGKASRNNNAYTDQIMPFTILKTPQQDHQPLSSLIFANIMQHADYWFINFLNQFDPEESPSPIVPIKIFGLKNMSSFATVYEDKLSFVYEGFLSFRRNDHATSRSVSPRATSLGLHSSGGGCPIQVDFQPKHHVDYKTMTNDLHTSPHLSFLLFNPMYYNV